MNKHATNKQNKVSSWYCTNFVSPENKKTCKKVNKNDRGLQKNLTTWLSVCNWSKNNSKYGYCDVN